MWLGLSRFSQHARRSSDLATAPDDISQNTVSRDQVSSKTSYNSRPVLIPNFFLHPLLGACDGRARPHTRRTRNVTLQRPHATLHLGAQGPLSRCRGEDHARRLAMRLVGVRWYRVEPQPQPLLLHNPHLRHRQRGWATTPRDGSLPCETTAPSLATRVGGRGVGAASALRCRGACLWG